ncbi:hypothetical protein GDO86_017688 [Hymenochirus boettgeri]|uniref:Olfactory receptor n=1 Tax=Hymenochirus boettgeri TaxID=247094 RepID=A0A8T2ITJ3_9PIPI|nr:hypothetical protein GDO86_017688 [Hymenochirus boettgeri]
MERGKNLKTNITEFLLLGFSDLQAELQLTVFLFFLSAYLLTLFCNILIIVIITIDFQLHVPMYLFLRNLSFLEMCSITVTAPKAMQIFVSGDKSISFLGCASQMLVFFTVAVSECLFLTVMAFDRYLAICCPLRYSSIMSKETCHCLTVASWLVGFLLTLGQTIFIFSLPFCASNHIYHFFCDIPPVLSLACTNIFINQLSVFIVCSVAAVIPFLLILCSYANIAYSIALIKSTTGRHKAISTCGSHLTSVILFYGTAMVVYLRLNAQEFGGINRGIALFYCIVIPVINPLIYSLKNKDLKSSLMKYIEI